MYQSHTNSAFDFDTKSKTQKIIANSIMHVNKIKIGNIYKLSYSKKLLTKVLRKVDKI